MKRMNSIEVKILEICEDKIKVKLPFANIPIQMNRPFFKKRLKAGYFKVNQPEHILRLFKNK